MRATAWMYWDCCDTRIHTTQSRIQTNFFCSHKAFLPVDQNVPAFSPHCCSQLSSLKCFSWGTEDPLEQHKSHTGGQQQEEGIDENDPPLPSEDNLVWIQTMVYWSGTASFSFSGNSIQQMSSLPGAERNYKQQINWSLCVNWEANLSLLLTSGWLTTVHSMKLLYCGIWMQLLPCSGSG